MATFHRCDQCGGVLKDKDVRTLVALHVVVPVRQVEDSMFRTFMRLTGGAMPAPEVEEGG